MPTRKVVKKTTARKAVKKTAARKAVKKTVARKAVKKTAARRTSANKVLTDILEVLTDIRGRLDVATSEAQVESMKETLVAAQTQATKEILQDVANILASKISPEHEKFLMGMVKGDEDQEKKMKKFLAMAKKGPLLFAVMHSMKETLVAAQTQATEGILRNVANILASEISPEHEKFLKDAVKGDKAQEKKMEKFLKMANKGPLLLAVVYFMKQKDWKDWVLAILATLGNWVVSGSAVMPPLLGVPFPRKSANASR